MPHAVCVEIAGCAEELFLDTVQYPANILLFRALDSDGGVLLLGSGCRGIKRR